MRKFLVCAASAAALLLVANAADTAAQRKSVPAAPAKAQAAPKPAAVTAKPPVSTARPATAARPTASKPATPAAPAARSTATAARRTSPAGLPKRPATTWRNRQALPTADRYKEIQEALAAKGYMQPGDASGHWDQGSIEALKKFQADQKLDSTGKLNSLSLIALGLGPKYEASPSALPGAPAAQPVPTIIATPVAPAAPPATAPPETR